jgi:glycogen debranching enzyme
MIVLKNNFSHCHLNDEGMVTVEEDKLLVGLFHADVRLLKHYVWQFHDFTLLQQNTGNLSKLSQMWAVLEHHHQTVSLERTFTLDPTGCHDIIHFHNTTRQTQTISLRFLSEFDHQDAMTLRGVGKQATKADVTETPVDQARHLHCDFGQNQTRTVSLSMRINDDLCCEFPESITLNAFETLNLEVNVRYEQTPFETAAVLPNLRIHENDKLSQQSWADLSGLLFSINEGVVPAAGLPRFACPFGRDSLLTAFLMLDSAPMIAEGTLKFLAKHIGSVTCADNDEEPGKILHEYRWGPQSQLNNIPFAPYYGSADATPLFVWLWAMYCKINPKSDIEEGLLTQVCAATNWILTKITEGDGFIRFRENAKGLKFHGWKDSPTSMCHADGEIAEGDIAVVEVQGYAWAALTQVQTLLRNNNQSLLAAQCEAAAHSIFQQIQLQLWDEKLEFYVMGLDGKNNPMRVVSSNVGHLLWANAVPSTRVEKVRRRLFKDDLWSGWGFRTLASTETSYNALSYHNGSVWPHDTALITLGLQQYGFSEDARKVATEIRNLATSQSNFRLPELVAGYSKTDWNPPIPYPGTCSPQAWAAAALLGTKSLLD